jgi:hypothetical protein
MEAFIQGTIIIGGSVAIALLGLWFVRLKISPELLQENHEVAGYMLSIVGTLYAVLLGLIVVNVQDKFENANQMALHEADCLSDLAHLSELYSKEDSQEIMRHLYAYAKTAREQDWSKISVQEAKEETLPHYRALWHAINKLELTNVKQQNSFSTVLVAMTRLADARRFRMVAGHNVLPPILWAVLIIGELLIVWFTYFFFVKSMRAQTMMTVFVVVFLSLIIFLVFLYDNPYRSELGARYAARTFHPEWFTEYSSHFDSSAHSIETETGQ